MADDKIYLVSSRGVEVEVPEGSASRRSDSRGFAAGGERFFETTDPRVDRPGSHERVLGPFEVTLLEGSGRLFEHGRRIIEDRVCGRADHALGVDRQQCVNDHCGAAPDQRFEEAVGQEAGLRGSEGYHQDHCRDGSFVHAELSSTDEYGDHHRQSHQYRALYRPDTDEDTRRSAIATPKATPSVNSTTRLPRWPTANPSEMTAAIGANSGRSCPRISIAKNQATPAATAVWRICHHPPQRRCIPERNRLRTRA